METQDSISKWAIATFGYPKSTKKIVERFVEEVIELDTKSAQTPIIIDSIRDECADCLIVLYQVAQTYGFDLHRAVNEKMTINQERIWKTDGDGVGQHVD
jgi:NTP pyrophosphatase (non-canonical NTP hydrolase)